MPPSETGGLRHMQSSDTMNDHSRYVSVCICTFQRPELLSRLLNRLEQQRTDDRFDYSIVVTDNDAQRSGEAVVAEFARRSFIPVKYDCEAVKNIALARNKAIEQSEGDFIAFIDDDEFPEPDWLLRMLITCEEYQTAGVLGPVRPHFEKIPPSWILKGRFCERPEHPTGRVMHWEESRTGNLLFRRGVLKGAPKPFSPEFGTGARTRTSSCG